MRVRRRINTERAEVAESVLRTSSNEDFFVVGRRVEERFFGFFSFRTLVFIAFLHSGLRWVAGPGHTKGVLVFCAGGREVRIRSLDRRVSLLHAPIFHNRLQGGLERKSGFLGKTNYRFKAPERWEDW